MVPDLDERAPSRGNMQLGSGRFANSKLSRPVSPTVGEILAGLYGWNWRRRASLVFGCAYQTICSIGTGYTPVSREMLQHLRDQASDPQATAAFIRRFHERSELELARQLDDRKAVARWCDLLLSGAAQLRVGRIVRGRGR